MVIYIFDGSFEGLLTSIYESYYSNNKAEKIISDNNCEKNFIDKYFYIETDNNKADKVYNAAVEKISQNFVENAFYAFLTEDIDSPTLIYNYFRLGFKLGRSVDMHLEDSIVFTVHKMSQKVTKEVHIMKGLLRFSKLKDEIYFAAIEPDNNITMLLAPHFKDRFSDQRWIIKDIKRGIAAVYNKEEWLITDSLHHDLPSLSDGEEIFQSLWKEYYKSISISERTNSKLQKRFMPVRYWKHLIEKS